MAGFEELLARFERHISILGRSPRTFDNYSRHVASMALHFQCLPTELDPEQVKDYLYLLQQRSKTPSQTYFKHTVYGLRFLLKTEGLPYEYLHLPSIPKSTKLPLRRSDGDPEPGGDLVDAEECPTSQAPDSDRPLVRVRAALHGGA